MYSALNILLELQFKPLVYAPLLRNRDKEFRTPLFSETTWSVITLELLAVNVAKSHRHLLHNVEAEHWVAQQVFLGAVPRKEDIEGKWLIYKVH